MSELYFMSTKKRGHLSLLFWFTYRFFRTKVNSTALVITSFLNFYTDSWIGKTDSHKKADLKNVQPKFDKACLKLQDLIYCWFVWRENKNGFSFVTKNSEFVGRRWVWLDATRVEKSSYILRRLTKFYEIFTSLLTGTI